MLSKFDIQDTYNPELSYVTTWIYAPEKYGFYFFWHEGQ